MEHSRSLITSVVLVGLLFFILADHAHAYVDPGTGSYVLQVIIAGLLGGAFAVKIYWKRIKAFFSNLFSGEEKEDGGK